MRAHELLLEYNSEKTLANYGAKIAAKVARDKSILPQPGGTTLTPDEISASVLNKIENADPTTHKEYTQWLVRQYVTSELKLEDVLSRGADNLAVFNELKSRKKLPANMRDINRLSFKELELSLVPLYDLLHPLNNTSNGTAEKVFEDDEWLVVIPKDVAAAQKYGAGTQWCTAAKKYNRFEFYNNAGPLYILIPKKPQHEREKYQFHFKTNQFMDETDEPIEVLQFFDVRASGRLREYFGKHTPAKNWFYFLGNDAQPRVARIFDKIKLYFDNLAEEKYADDDQMRDDMLAFIDLVLHSIYRKKLSEIIPDELCDPEYGEKLIPALTNIPFILFDLSIESRRLYQDSADEDKVFRSWLWRVQVSETGEVSFKDG